jgi:hypothetical protein
MAPGEGGMRGDRTEVCVWWRAAQPRSWFQRQVWGSSLTFLHMNAGPTSAGNISGTYRSLQQRSTIRGKDFSRGRQPAANALRNPDAAIGVAGQG